jgi:uncharacterized protein YgiM (DUF1202 family)
VDIEIVETEVSMSTSRRFNRRQFLLGSAGAATLAFVPAARHAGAQSSGFPVGANIVTNASAWLRSGPGLSYSVIVTLWNGAPLTVTGAPVSADGYTWYPIRTGYGTEGWIADVALAAGTVPNPAFGAGDSVVTTGAANVRAGAGLSYSVVVTLWSGAPLTVTGAPVAASGYTWYPIRTGYGTTGWVAGSLLKAGTAPTPPPAPTPTFPVGSTAYATGAINVRSGAGLNYSVIVALWNGAPVTITGAPVSASGYTWYPIRTGYGTEGWIAGELLRK